VRTNLLRAFIALLVISAIAIYAVRWGLGAVTLNGWTTIANTMLVGALVFYWVLALGDRQADR
jgi:hypothetical protein